MLYFTIISLCDESHYAMFRTELFLRTYYQSNEMDVPETGGGFLIQYRAYIFSFIVHYSYNTTNVKISTGTYEALACKPVKFFILMIVVVWPWHFSEGSYNDPRLKAEGHYGCQKVRPRPYHYRQPTPLLTGY